MQGELYAGGVRVTDETAGWRVVYEVRGPVAAIASIRFEPASTSPLPDLPATLARELLRPGEAIRCARGHLPGALGPESATALSSLGPTRQGSRRDDHFYAVIADCYVKAIASGSPSPVRDVAEGLGREASLVRDALFRARRRKLLTRPATPKQAGGTLTQAGHNALLNHG